MERERSDRSARRTASGNFDPSVVGVRTFLKNWPIVLSQMEKLSVSLKRRQVSGPYHCAKATLELLRYTVGTCKWATAAQLMELIRAVGRELIAAKPSELAVGNVVRRVLFVIREEYTAKLRQAEDAAASGAAAAAAAEVSVPSLETVLGGEQLEADFSAPLPDLKQLIIEGLNELKAELEEMNSVICERAAETIHANEVVLTLGRSATVEQFLLAAADHYRKARLTFSVIVAEAAPGLRGHELARALAAAGIETTVISDSAVFAIMARVNKVIMPTHAVVANGGLVAGCGSYMIALAAKELSVPVVCVTGLYKLCPLFPHDQDTFNCLLAPSAVLPYEDTELAESIEVLNPAYDYIPPELVDLYMTNIGGHQPSYIYRLLAEYYHRDDYILAPEFEG
ncbi:eukaryotic translation initiation factor 2B beta subunit [Tribonema minus]|uniref:Translation initiation factor eIF2B subunit beta n=1 Tax=Tribonema minus TaxID=303371 RepID=A0A836CBW3_9STRA|nr:eukaryotic translation initiation factor 2B beta subunit [Tribonema minus]